jgi:hypothetical protein
MRTLVFGIAVGLCACATPAPKVSEPVVVTQRNTDPLAAATHWAAEPVDAPEFVSAWSNPAEVLRLYRDGDVVKAVVGQAGISDAHQCVLLTLTQTNGIWRVSGTSEVASTHLLPTF